MSQKPQIAHFIWWIPHYRSTIFKRLSQNQKIDFVVYAGNNMQVVGGNYVASANATGKLNGINWKHVDSIRIKWWPFKDYEWQPLVIKECLRGDFDATIFLGRRSLSNIVSKVLCRFRGIKVIDWTQGVRGPEGFLKWTIHKLEGKLADAHLIYGQFATQWYIDHGFPEERVFTVRNSLEYEEQLLIRKSLNQSDIIKTRTELGCTNETSRIIFFSGRLQKNKELNLLISAISKLNKRNKDVKLLFIGDGPEENELRRNAANQKVLEKIIFYGACYNEKVLGKLISSADLCVIPGALGLTAIHSLVYGVPVLTHNNVDHIHGPEIEAVVKGKTGDYFKRGDSNHLSEMIERMLYPEPCKTHMYDNCLRMVDENYTPEYQERVIIKCLNSVLPVNKKI